MPAALQQPKPRTVAHFFDAQSCLLVFFGVKKGSRASAKKAPVSPVAQLRAREPRQDAFLAAYERLGFIRAAAEQCGIRSSAHYEWLRTDSDYAQRFGVVDRIVVQSLEDEMVRRGRDGYPVLKSVAGQAVRMTEYSDQLLMFALRGRRPEVYGDRFKGEISGPNGGPIQTQSRIDLSLLTDEQLAQFEALALAAAKAEE
jgi:hypothetical protein